MQTEVFLLNDVPELGVEGDVVSVADGYARNYLLPRKLATAVTPATRLLMEKKQREREVKREAALVEGQKRAEALKDVSCTIPVKISEEDKLYGSVSEGDIVEALQAQGIIVEKKELQLDEPIRQLGQYDIPVRVHPDLDITIKVQVVEE